MRDHRRQEILYITESARSLEYLLFAKALRTVAVGLRDCSPQQLGSDPNIVVDVDLRSPKNIRELTKLLARPGTGCRVFLVDPRISAAHLIAKALKADVILPPRCDPGLVHAAIRNYFQYAAEPEVTRSIDAGIMALDTGFRTLLRDEIFDSAGMEDASNQIIDAIDSAGVDQWMATVRGYHVGTFQHCMIVTATASSFARKLGMRRSDVVKVTAAALVHDIGKSAVPLEILDKPGQLTTSEMTAMREHPAIGHRYLAERSRLAADALSSVRSHHEYLDGSGYPDGLSGPEIDDITRIITISDIYGAMVERRAYKPPKRPEEAFAVLEVMAAAGKIEMALVRAFGALAIKRAA